ncbi:MAG: hypothetical protein H7343_00920 [Undibacterium sp.]|nr:hypothetical protein [Opitutaceae bacterium]
MLIAGSSPSLAATFFPEGFVTQLLSFVLDAWKSLARPKPGEVEERITGRLFEHMVDEYPRRGLPLTIMPETPLYDAKTGIAYGRTDFRFLHREIPSQRVYLTVETKRLNIPQPSGSVKGNLKAYVGPEGMERFISGKYSSGLPEAAMLAYVMDGKITVAAGKISKLCAVWATQLSAVSKPVFGLHPVLAPPHGLSEHARSTAHGGPIKLHHLFVAA